MASPPRGDTVLSSSPTSIHGRGSPVLRRRESAVGVVVPADHGVGADSSANNSSRPPRLSPTLSRSYDPDDPQTRERQRTMDVDMAIQLSRARRETITATSPIQIGGPSTSPVQESPHLAAFSPHEQHEIDLARGHSPTRDILMQDSLDETSTPPMHHPLPSPTLDLRSHLHQTHDPSLLASANVMSDHHDLNMGGLPTYQATAQHASEFDFEPMEFFASDERAMLGLTPRSAPKSSSTSAQDESVPSCANEPDPSGRTRQRKLSQSTPTPRPRKGAGGKLAAPGARFNEPLPVGLGLLPGGSSPVIPYNASFDEGERNLPLSTGHDRPYRFSFYSNALSATIHARSLCELPADGQTFEELFQGTGGSPEMHHKATSSAPGGNSRGLSGLKSALANSKPGARDSFGQSSKAGFDPKKAPADEDKTWWLDVTSPTDEEMKMLSKVFNIHPLTTEDIQMEEIREKIELFRNYYLVCFRSFDQDQYSPTYLEPLNMYIIVFREGILSFHFQPTPHPQNVRRRIKQLKDYISVTSDWISYALIDDITDGFGPLIQGIEFEVDSIDELVLIIKDAEQSDMLRRIGMCRKKVMGLLRLMGNKADVVKGLAKRCNENWRVAPTSDIGLYLSDIQDHLITMTQNLNHYEKILARSHSNYLAQISIEMTDANNQINDVLSKLTALGTVLIPMNLVTGLWGMNVHVPGQDNGGYAWFASIIACLAAFAIIGGYSTYRFMVRN